MAGSVVLGTLKYILGLDSVAFKKGMTEAERELVVAQKRMIKQGEQLQQVGKNMATFITLPLAGLAAKGIKEAQETAQAMAQVNAVLDSMGPVAGRTAEQLQKAADAMELKSLYEADEILRKVTPTLLQFGKISGEVFDRAQQAVVDYASRSGKDLQAVSIAFGKALNDPIKGLTALGRVGITFTDAQKKNIKAMVDGGKTAQAQAFILGELEKKFKGAAEAAQNTDPLNKLNDAFNQMAEAVGTKLLPLIPPITNAIVNLLDKFSSLSPETQKWAMYAAAAAAAAGPLVFVFGSLLKVLAPVLPLLLKLGPAGTAAGAGATAAAGGATALGTAILPLAALIGGVYLAYKNWDKIAPYIEGVSKRTQDFVTKTNGWLKSIQDEAAKLDKQTGVPSKQVFFKSIQDQVSATWAKWNSFDLADWATRMDGHIARFAQGAWRSFEDMVNRANAAFARLIAGARESLINKFESIKTGIKEKVDQITGFFRNMYIAVVGRSYVPDMVTEIGQHMNRLDDTMVKPAKDKAKAAAEAFRQLKDEVAGILDRLFPEQSRANQFANELRVLETGLKAMKVSAEATAEAVRRLREEYRRDVFGEEELPEWLTAPTAPDTMPVDMDQIEFWTGTMNKANKDLADGSKRTAAEVVEAYGYMAQGVLDGLQSVVGAIKDGNWIDAIQGVLDIVLQVLGTLSSLGVIKGVPSTPPITPRARGGPVVPGRTYLVGEQGPEFVRFGSRGYVHPNKSGPSQRVMIVPSPYFDAVVDNRAAQVAAPMAGQAAMAGATGGVAAATRRQDRNFYSGRR